MGRPIRNAEQKIMRKAHRVAGIYQCVCQYKARSRRFLRLGLQVAAGMCWHVLACAGGMHAPATSPKPAAERAKLTKMGLLFVCSLKTSIASAPRLISAPEPADVHTSSEVHVHVQAKKTWTPAARTTSCSTG